MSSCSSPQSGRAPTLIHNTSASCSASCFNLGYMALQAWHLQGWEAVQPVP